MNDLKKIYFKSECGAGDIVNISPLLHYLSNYYEVYSDLKPEGVFKIPNKLKKYDEKEKYDYIFPINFISGVNIPATNLLNIVESTLNIKIPLKDLGKGIFFSEDEIKYIDTLKKDNYIYISSYTSIKQKRINPLTINSYLKKYFKNNYNIVTHKPEFDNSSNNYAWESIENLKILPAVNYFSREWILYLAGANTVLACDGGGFNTALAVGTPVVGFLTIADESLCTFYKNNNYEIVQSSLSCSPCFKPADYGNKDVIGCVSINNPCGNNFNIGEDVCE